ncbi:histidine kinase/DNA gyrase B/HSP90-like ATPase [Solirubrobacter pauli]|uniref:histidine kinase n=1 Tax=Solirubrobacter pauli TaxID=166793 RepID=A0A660LDG7_9ACTN|nr:histidine kinase [Solirubrobacter pauli]RKQ93062.1 histidine kinase/DNA gyrase B/HSP90-like ATPase [Solirubrobacter pauli]
MIRVALLDHDEAALRRRIEQDRGLEVVAAAPDPASLARRLGGRRPDVLVLGYDVRADDALPLCWRAKCRSDAPRVLIHAVGAGPALAIAARVAKADGVVDAAASGPVLAAAIRAVAAGEPVLPTVARADFEAAVKRLADEDLPTFALLLDDVDAADVADHVVDAERRVLRIVDRIRPRPASRPPVRAADARGLARARARTRLTQRRDAAVQHARILGRRALDDVVGERELVEAREAAGVVEAGRAVAEQDLGLQGHGHRAWPRSGRPAMGPRLYRGRWSAKLVRVVRRISSLPLFWRVFAANASVLVLAFAGLVFAPITVSVPVGASELLVLALGLVALLAANLVLLRPAFSPLDELAETMRKHDPLAPGARAGTSGDPDVAALARTFNDMLDRLESERRESARQALLVQEAERQRVARELHDEVGQTLTGVMLQIEGLALNIPDELRGQLEQLRETARHGTEEVRNIARRLRPDALEELGLSPAIVALAGAFERQTRVPVTRTVEPMADLAPEEELVIYRVAQEALTNIARHAEAGAVTIDLRRLDAGIVLEVRDDGRGLPDGAERSSQGIRGMRERAMLIGAGLAIESRPGHGTTVRLAIPPHTDDPA